MNLSWSFGINSEIPENIHNLANANDKWLLYAASNTGVIYDWVNSTQKHLRGHCNEISAIASSKCKRWVITADQGKDSLMIVWEINVRVLKAEMPTICDAVPIKTFFGIHGDKGARSVKFSADAKYIISLGCEDEGEQTLYIYNWTASNDPVVTLKIGGELQEQVFFNPEDRKEIMTIGKTSVNFYRWTESGLIQNVPNISDLRHPVSSYLHACFLPGKGEAITVTSDGEVIVWSNTSLKDLSRQQKNGTKSAIKYLKIHNSAINCISVIKNKYIVSGGNDGFVKIFDLQFKIIAWFENLNAGPINCISESGHGIPVIAGLDISELIVSTKHGKVLLLESPSLAEATEQELAAKKTALLEPGSLRENPSVICLFEGQYGAVRAISAHPRLNLFALGGDSGYLQIWDHNLKTVLCSKLLVETTEDGKSQTIPMKISTIVFSPSGNTIAIGFANGWIRYLSADKIVDLPQSRFTSRFGYNVSEKSIERMVFSEDGNMLAFSDSNYGVGLFQKKPVKVNNDTESQSSERVHERIEWVFIGKAKAHSKSIVNVLFVPPLDASENTRLISISSDRSIVEYNLEDLNITEGLKILNSRKIEQIYRPLAAVLVKKKHRITPEQFLLTFNTGLKLKLFNSKTQLCRKTVLGPSFTDDMKELKLISTNDQTTYMAFTSKEKVAGLMKLPLDGNPHRSMGIIAHPCEVSSLIATSNGSFLITAGSTDSTAFMWTINYTAIDKEMKDKEQGLEPFINMLDGSGLGEDGPAYRELEDYFYYAQLRSQGEDARKDRKISDTVKLGEVPYIMQAMGFYATQQEIDDMVNEVRYSKITEGTSELEVDTITFSELIKLYVNHRPYVDVTEDDMNKALSKVMEGSDISREKLQLLLQQYGEPMQSSEFESCFSALIERDSKTGGKLDDKIAPKKFIEDILGLV